MTDSKVSNLASVCTQPQSLLYTAVVSTALLYKLEPGADVECTDRIAFAQNTAAGLLHQAMFLRGGTDENVSYNPKPASF